MTRRTRTFIGASILLGAITGGAAAAFLSSTENTGNTFTTRAVTSRPVITGTRITTDANCGPATPAETIRQGTTYYACVQSVTDPAGISSVTADLSATEGDSSVPLFTAGGPWSGYAYRTAARTADVPLETGSSSAWSVRATNTTSDSATLSGLTLNIRSYPGLLRGEFGGAGTANLTQYYQLNDAGTTAPNLGTGGAATGTYNGTPVRQVAGALVGNINTALTVNGTTDYLSVPRLAALNSNYTAEIWVKGTGASGSGPGTIWRDSAGLIDAGNGGSNNDWGVSVDASGRIVAGCGNGATIRSAVGVLADGNWHHIVFTRTRTTGAIALYVDGASVATGTTCNTTAHNGSTTVWLGRSHESGLYLSATLDEAVMYNRVLGAAEILDHYRLATGTG